MTDTITGANSGLLLAALNDRSPVWARNPILAGYRGSHAHGTYLPPDDPHGTDDIDLFGVAVRDPNYYLGLGGYNPNNKGTFTCAGETVDIETHEVRKFVSLLMKGNPNVHQHLWLRPEHYLVIRRPARILIDRRRDFLSRRLFESFGGYAYAQFKRMQKFEKRGYMGQKREKIVQQYGYDIKNAAHCIRLLLNAIDLARQNVITVWLEGADAEKVKAIKSGKWSFSHVVEFAESLRADFDVEKEANKDLPPKVDIETLNPILRDLIAAEWEELHVSL